MLSRRIIPCLDVNAGRVVKGVKFQQLRDAGVSEAMLHTVQVDNPRRFLAFVPKSA